MLENITNKWLRYWIFLRIIQRLLLLLLCLNYLMSVMSSLLKNLIIAVYINMGMSTKIMWKKVGVMNFLTIWIINIVYLSYLKEKKD